MDGFHRGHYASKSALDSSRLGTNERVRCGSTPIQNNQIDFRVKVVSDNLIVNYRKYTLFITLMSRMIILVVSNYCYPFQLSSKYKKPAIICIISILKPGIILSVNTVLTLSICTNRWHFLYA